MKRTVRLIGILLISLSLVCALRLLVPIFMNRWISSPSWSPEGQRIAFVCHYPAILQILKHPQQVLEWGLVFDAMEICVSNISGQESTRITHNSVANYDPTWSPDGRLIAYITAGENGDIVEVVGDNGESVERFVTGLQIWGHIGRPRWSPLSDQLVFVAKNLSLDSASLNLYMADLKSGEVQPLLTTSNDTVEPSWSHDAVYLAFVEVTEGRYLSQTAAEVRVLELKTGKTRSLVTGFARISALVWNPQQSVLAFAGREQSESDFGGEWERPCQHIYAFDLTKQRLVKLTDDADVCVNPTLAWSSDGHSLAFGLGLVGKYEIGIMSLADNILIQVVPSKSFVNDLSWSPDGSSLLFTVGIEGEKHRIWVLDIATGEAAELALP